MIPVMTSTLPTYDPRDEFSFSNPEQAYMAGLHLDLSIDFDKKAISGVAEIELHWIQEANSIVLDTRDLDIQWVEMLDEHYNPVPLTWSLGPTHPVNGAPLVIQTLGQPRMIRIGYATSPNASGLQWIDGANGNGPMLFSQSQPIHARSWIPLMDTPRRKFCFSATIHTNRPTQVLMGAHNDPKSTPGTEHAFTMDQPIASYLLALAAGDFVFEPISHRCGIWASKDMAKVAAREFEDIETIMTQAERLCGPYPWGRYDILVLPDSFPFGGMENPCLTFLSPTVVVGDKSMVSLVAHELAHSWSGNLTTCSTQRDLWINEGMTCYIENRLVEAVYGDKRARLEAALAEQTLADVYTEVPESEQILVVEPGTMVDPDEFCVETVYTKGAMMFRHLEKILGRDCIDAFLRGHFMRHSFDVISAPTLAEELATYLGGYANQEVPVEEIQEWLTQPGIPSTYQPTHSELIHQIQVAAEQWADQKIIPRAENWSPQEWCSFLGKISQSIELEPLLALGERYGLTGTPNGEIAQRWYPILLRAGYQDDQGHIEAFLHKVGRQKMIVPVYAAMAQGPEGKEKARTIFEKARAGYHPLSAAAIDKLLSDTPG